MTVRSSGIIWPRIAFVVLGLLPTLGWGQLSDVKKWYASLTITESGSPPTTGGATTINSNGTATFALKQYYNIPAEYGAWALDTSVPVVGQGQASLEFSNVCGTQSTASSGPIAVSFVLTINQSSDPIGGMAPGTYRVSSVGFSFPAISTVTWYPDNPCEQTPGTTTGASSIPVPREGYEIPDAPLPVGVPIASTVLSGSGTQVTSGVTITYQYTVYPAPTGLSITTTSLPGTMSGLPYGPIALAATGGSGNYSWSASGLPPGFSISAGNIVDFSCSAAPPATYNVVLTVRDLTTGQIALSGTLPLVVSPLAMTVSPLRINQGVDLVSQGQVNLAVDPNNSTGVPLAMAGRATLAEAALSIPQLTACLELTNVPVVLTLQESQGGPVVSQITQMKTIDTYQNDGKVQFLVNQGLAATPSSIQPSILTITIDPNNTLNLTQSGHPASQAQPLGILPVGRPVQYQFRAWGFDPVPFFDATVAQSMSFLHGVYPLPEDNPAAPQLYSIGPDFLPTAFAPGPDTVDLQMLELFLAAQIQPVVPERTICIVPESWFETYYHTAIGVSYQKPNGIPGVAVVLEGAPYEVVAHELGHTYGFPDLYKIDSNGNVTCGDKCLANPNGTGYWVQKGVSISSTAIDIMGAAEGTNSWISDQHYWALFQNFIRAIPDPEVLLITGTISTSGTVTLWKLYRNNTGRVTPVAPGNGLVQILGKDGSVLQSATFDTTSQPTESWPGQAASPVPFALALPFDNAAFQVQVRIAGTLAAQVNVSSKLLVDAVDSIPDTGFAQNPSEWRNALLNKIGAFDSQLSAGAIEGARNQLKNDIEKSLQAWLMDGYTVKTALQYTKDQIIALVEELIQKLGS